MKYMTYSRLINCRAALVALGLGLTALNASAQHVNAGALNQSAGSQLYFANGASYVASSGYTFSMNYSNTGTYAGFFNTGSPTFTSLSYSNAVGPAFGTHLDLSIVSVAGPTGGTFSFWEEGATAPTLSLLSGATSSSLLFQLSANTSAGGTDPYGHLHGRRFAVDQAGSYTIGFQLLDSTGYHTASDVYYLTYVATVPEPAVGALGMLGLAGLHFMRRRK